MSYTPQITDKGFIVDVDKFIDGINYLKEKLRAENINPKLFLIENRNLKHTLISNINRLVAFKNSGQDKSNIFITLDFGQLFSVEAKTFQNPNGEVLDILKKLEENNLHEVIRGFHFYAITKSSTERRRPHTCPAGAPGDIDWKPIVNWINRHYNDKDECYILYEVFTSGQYAAHSYKYLKQLGLNTNQ